MLNLLFQFDIQLTNFINQLLPHNSFFDFFFSFFSLQGMSFIVWLLIIIFILFIEEKKHPGISKRDKKFLFYFFLSFLTTSFLVNVILKNFIQRPRPVSLFQSSGLFLSTCPRDFSFPSGHAATAFAAATVLSVFDKKRKWFYYIIAVIISFSRIYLGCHFFLDIFFGAIIGYIISKIYLFLLPKLVNLFSVS